MSLFYLNYLCSVACHDMLQQSASIIVHFQLFQVGVKKYSLKQSFCYRCLFDPTIRKGWETENSSLQEALIHHIIVPRSTILRKTYQIWTLGNDLPFGLWGADSVPYGDSFVLVGGYIEPDDAPSDAILLYNPTDDSWVVMEGALKRPKYNVKVIKVRRGIFPQC